MKALRTRRCRVASAPAPPSPQVDLDSDWQRYIRLLQKGCAELAVVPIGDDDHVDLVSRATAGALVKIRGGEATLLNQSRVRMKLEPLERQQNSPGLEMVAVGD